MTFIMFPATVITAWCADRQILSKFMTRKYHASRHKGVIVATEGMTDIEMEAEREVRNNCSGLTLIIEKASSDVSFALLDGSSILIFVQVIDSSFIGCSGKLWCGI